MKRPIAVALCASLAAGSCRSVQDGLDELEETAESFAGILNRLPNPSEPETTPSQEPSTKDEVPAAAGENGDEGPSATTDSGATWMAVGDGSVRYAVLAADGAMPLDCPDAIRSLTGSRFVARLNDAGEVAILISGRPVADPKNPLNPPVVPVVISKGRPGELRRYVGFGDEVRDLEASGLVLVGTGKKEYRPGPLRPVVLRSVDDLWLFEDGRVGFWGTASAERTGKEDPGQASGFFLADDTGISPAGLENRTAPAGALPVNQVRTAREVPLGVARTDGRFLDGGDLFVVRSETGFCGRGAPGRFEYSLRPESPAPGFPGGGTVRVTGTASGIVESAGLYAIFLATVSGPGLASPTALYLSGPDGVSLLSKTAFAGKVGRGGHVFVEDRRVGLWGKPGELEEVRTVTGERLEVKASGVFVLDDGTLVVQIVKNAGRLTGASMETWHGPGNRLARLDAGSTSAPILAHAAPQGIVAQKSSAGAVLVGRFGEIKRTLGAGDRITISPGDVRMIKNVDALGINNRGDVLLHCVFAPEEGVRDESQGILFVSTR